jgi:serine beta-lactamase-like protein LACTB
MTSARRVHHWLLAALAGTLLLTGAPPAAAQAHPIYPMPAPSTLDGAAIEQARAQVQELVRVKQVPGASVAVARDGVIIWSEGFGLADVEQGVPVTPLTRFRLGSVSKVITAAAVARLVETGALDLDAPIQRYVPDFPQKPWPITTRQLASHSAGIRHYLARDDAFPGLLAGNPHFASITAGLAIFKDDPLLFEPGTRYAYSSYGWNVIAAVIEGASRQEFLTFVQQHVLDRLGLRAIGPDHVRAIVPNRTRFYTRDEQGRLLNAPYIDSSYKWAGGGFLGNAEDLVRFGSAHLQPGFLRQETLDQLFTPRMPIGGGTSVGIGWRIGRDADGRRILHHGGTIEGGRALLLLFPDAKVAVAILTNALVDVREADAQRLGALFIR